MSSRNAYLGPKERQAALCLSQALRAAVSAVEDGERSVDRILQAMRERIAREPLATLDYVAVVDDDTFREIDELTGSARALVAARVGRARLQANFDVANLFNANTVLTVNAGYGGTTSIWPQALRILAGRVFKLGGQVDF